MGSTESLLRAAAVALACWLPCALCLPACRGGEGHTRRIQSTVPSRAQPSPCRTGEGTKLGVPFVRVCPRTSSGELVAPAFWIASVPLTCGAGEHDEVSCPPVVALRSLGGENPNTARIPSVQAALIDAFEAHRICTMRFAGRLPTHTERAQAREFAGLSTLAIVESREPSRFEFREIGEWVTETACDRPSVLGSECGAGVAPIESTTRVDWSGILACDARKVGSQGSLPIVGLSEICPVTGFEWGPPGARKQLPCAVHGPSVQGPDNDARYFELACETPGRSPAHPKDGMSRRAGARCLVPENLLDSHSP